MAANNTDQKNANYMDNDDDSIPMLLVLNKYDLAENLVNDGY